MDTVAQAARHVGETAGPAEQPLQVEVYRDSARASSQRLLEGAAEVLLLLSFLSLSRTTRAGLTALFEQRLRRAYEGVMP